MSNVCREVRGWCRSFTRTETYLSVLQVAFLIAFIALLTFIILHFLACNISKEKQDIIPTTRTETAVTTVSKEIYSEYTKLSTPTPLGKGIECTWTPSHKTSAATNYYEELMTSTKLLKNVTKTSGFTKYLSNDTDGAFIIDERKNFLLALVKFRPPQDITFGCTLTKVAEKWTLTAASCIESIDEQDYLDSFVMMEGLAEDTQIIHAVTDVVIHPQYQGVNMSYDLAALKSEDSLIKDGNKVVSLATLIDYLSITIGERLALIGYGKFRNIDKDPLARSIREVSAYILPLEQCPTDNAQWSPRHLVGGEPIARGFGGEAPICAGILNGRNTPCNYCAGAPLLYRLVLVGLMSANPQCGLACDPALYVNIALVRDWIDSVIYSE